MKHVTQKLIEINGTPVDIKARLERNGWVVITFTPTFSIRSAKLHLPFARDTFISAIVCGLLDEEDPNYNEKYDTAYAEVNSTLILVTGNFNVE
jgi:hypothetical protein